MQDILKPILRDAFDTCPVKSPVKPPRSQVKSPRSPIKPPLDPTALNIVWHVRSGDVCPHCDNPSYYDTIYQFIARSLSRKNLTEESGKFSVPQSNHRALQSNVDWTFPHQNIIVHQRYFSPHVPSLFSTVPYLVLFNSEDIGRVVETILHADILVTTYITSLTLVTTGNQLNV